jgi:medium-chain acyl-[acyl-carrier-protein] hydrolase
MILRESFTVRYYETGADGALFPHILCGFLQEIAGHHASALGVGVETLLSKGFTWFLSKLRLIVERFPRPGESIEVRTWPVSGTARNGERSSGADRLFALRDFSVMDAGGACIASAASAWLVMDTAARRPARIQSVWDPPDTSGLGRAIPGNMERVAPMRRGTDEGEKAPDFTESRFPVLYSDIDVNGHANNTSYIRWIVESSGAEILDTRRLASLSLDFLAETRKGGAVVARTRRLKPGGSETRLAHELSTEGERLIARAETSWREK